MDKKIGRQNCRIKSATVVLDTLWVGLISRHILAMNTTLPERAWKRPIDNQCRKGIST